MTIIRRSLAFTAWALLIARPTLGGQAAAPTASPSADYAQEAYVIEQSRTTWRFENDGTGRHDSYLRVRVQSEAGVQSWGQLAFPYTSANERMEVVFVRVLKADGTVITASADAVQDLSSAVQREAPVYTDTREKHITVPGLRPGEVLELALATVVQTPLARGHFWTEHEFIRNGIVLDERLQIDVPGDRKITLKTRPGFEPTMTERDGRRIYEWHTSRRTSDEDSARAEREVPRKPRKPEPSAVRLTTFASWEELGRWYGDLERPQRTPGPEIRKKAAELTADRVTDLEKLEALYEYVATNFRYVSLSFGVGRYQPHAAAEVLRNQYGDCKDKHTLLASLSESIGLHTSAALINSSNALDPDFPSPSQFDHVMTRVLVGSEEVWLDTTTEVAPFRLLSPSLREKQTLVVDASGAARLEETPAAPPMANATAVDIDSTLSESGTLSAQVRLAFSGDYELLMRTIFRRTPNAQWKTILKGLSDRGELDGDIGDWKVANPAALREPFTIEYHVAKASFVTRTKKQFELELPLSQWISIMPRDVSEADAVSPIALGSVRQSTYKIRIELPASFAGHTPLAVSMKRDYAEYRADYKLDGHLFTAERSLSFSSSELPPARRGDYAAFARGVSGDLRQSLALESSAAAAINPPAQLSVKELYNSGTDAVESRHYAEAVTLLKRAVELDPSYAYGAWTNLGRAYMGLHETDAAIEAFRKQIDLDAYDQYAYNNLGYAYRSLKKFAEAEAAFSRQLEINPLDVFARESLGGLHLEQHRYSDAALEFDKAIALSPKKAVLHVRLGEALLNLREQDRARAAFARAVELDPSPPTWNNIAYQLALNSTDLELAQRYAESAVAAVTAASRTVSIDHVTARDLGQSVSMGFYWDTLGWVYFAKGDIDRAEKLVAAAWILTQDAEAGDHLAQIYEKQGRREDAIHTYAVAMGAGRPDKKIRERLVALLGADRVDPIAQKNADQLRHERTIALTVTGPEGAAADFFVLFDNRSGSAAFDGVTFISGDERLRRLADALPKAKYDATFPDSAPAKILRRGTLSCAGSAGPASCRFILMLPAEAQAAEPE